MTENRNTAREFVATVLGLAASDRDREWVEEPSGWWSDFFAALGGRPHVEKDAAGNKVVAGSAPSLTRAHRRRPALLRPVALSATVLVVLAIVVGISDFEIVSWLLGIDITILALLGGVAAFGAAYWIVEQLWESRSRKKESQRVEAERAAEEQGSTSNNRDPNVASDDWDDYD